jgi:hypothetical protein
MAAADAAAAEWEVVNAVREMVNASTAAKAAPDINEERLR